MSDLKTADFVAVAGEESNSSIMAKSSLSASANVPAGNSATATLLRTTSTLPSSSASVPARSVSTAGFAKGGTADVNTTYVQMKAAMLNSAPRPATLEQDAPGSASGSPSAQPAHNPKPLVRRFRQVSVNRNAPLRGVGVYQFQTPVKARLGEFEQIFGTPETSLGDDAIDQGASPSPGSNTVAAAATPEPEFLIEDYACAFKDGMLMVQGRMYISNQRICFYCDFLGFGEKRISLAFGDVKEAYKKSTAIVFPNAIEIHTNSGGVLFFASFLMRDRAYATVKHLLRHHAEVTRLLVAPADLKNPAPRNDSSSSSGSESDFSSSAASEPESDANSGEERDVHSASPQVDMMALRTSSPPPPRVRQSHQSFTTEYEPPSAKSNRRSAFLTAGSLSDPDDAQESSFRFDHRVSLDAERAQTDESQRHEDNDTHHVNLTNTPPCSASCEHADDDSNLDTNSKKVAWHTTFDFPDVTILECWQILLETPKFWLEHLHPKLDYTKNLATEWSAKTSSTSGHPCCWSRVIDFISPVKQRLGPIAPKSTNVLSTQRVRMLPGTENGTFSGLIYEAVSISQDVPYGDTFALVNRWEFRPSAEGSGVTCRMGSRVKWLKGLPWGASIIERTVVAGGTEFCVLWKGFALSYISEQRQMLAQEERRGDRSRARSKRRAARATAAIESSRVVADAAAASAPTIPSHAASAPIYSLQPEPATIFGISATSVQMGAMAVLALVLAYLLGGILVGALFSSRQPMYSGSSDGTVGSISDAEFWHLRQDVEDLKESISELNLLFRELAPRIGANPPLAKPSAFEAREASRLRRERYLAMEIAALERDIAKSRAELDGVREQGKSTCVGDECQAPPTKPTTTT